MIVKEKVQLLNNCTFIKAKSENIRLLKNFYICFCEYFNCFFIIGNTNNNVCRTNLRGDKSVRIFNAYSLFRESIDCLRKSAWNIRYAYSENFCNGNSKAVIFKNLFSLLRIAYNQTQNTVIRGISN